MKIRFIAKKHGVPLPRQHQNWGVYDVERGSWPVLVAGLGKIAHPVASEDLAQAEANRLAEFHGLPKPYP